MREDSVRRRDAGRRGELEFGRILETAVAVRAVRGHHEHVNDLLAAQVERGEVKPSNASTATVASGAAVLVHQIAVEIEKTTGRFLVRLDADEAARHVRKHVAPSIAGALFAARLGGLATTVLTVPTVREHREALVDGMSCCFIYPGLVAL